MKNKFFHRINFKGVFTSVIVLFLAYCYISPKLGSYNLLKTDLQNSEFVSPFLEQSPQLSLNDSSHNIPFSITLEIKLEDTTKVESESNEYDCLFLPTLDDFYRFVKENSEIQNHISLFYQLVTVPLFVYFHSWKFHLFQ